VWFAMRKGTPALLSLSIFSSLYDELRISISIFYCLICDLENEKQSLK
jgi:hypothetical protein